MDEPPPDDEELLKSCENLDELHEQYFSIRQIKRGVDCGEKIVFVRGRHIHYQGTKCRMIIIREVTALVKYEKLKIHSHFTDMLTATISHDMRTPLNAIISVSKNLAYHLS